ncbi:hypothetical protein JQ615_36900 [Bradyrhizobium jicamae]|uniref:HNH endonuclease n=1 Tax=Bradyrhizobium jicamae TaxID=280332 RepID=A0ABS5FVW6_9BRAD|nr:hypothetical protein [Bradyrhizobium jicamae]MBR0800954.1 hypothetical protein [Bradyrhizobium jicamae]MBR0939307.1 hypothetical protein [Bradyrhizobium jicamae]
MTLAQELDDLFARAEAAAIEAERLIEINLERQRLAHGTVHRMQMGAIFDWSDLAI